ncbi:MAG: 4-hydroxy-3-methylbut-2-enyl diphosphate reductase [Candidatus Moraniibacteriota bacterium]|nr:MAG: 4-hydroxy-3-methylbut-2-enyl diphosphate reductase [Candidatus Moranbacteria bacterium]
MNSIKKVLIAQPHGFCAGVARAVKAVEDTLAIFGAPVYVKHEIVHNKHVVDAITKQGAITVETLEEVPEGSVVIFSAHGSPRAHYEVARERQLHLIDATCPLVTKVHLEVLRFIKEGYRIIYIGHRGHIEGVGVLGEAPGVSIPVVETVADVEALTLPTSDKLVYLTQTTLSIDETRAVIAALRKKYPQIVAPPLEDICYATTNRQEAVKALAKTVPIVIVVGSVTSSNSNRLRETAEQAGARAYLVDDASDLEAAWFDGVSIVGVTGGASAPEDRIQTVIDYFTGQGAVAERFSVKEEKMFFAEPVELMQIRRERAAKV